MSVGSNSRQNLTNKVITVPPVVLDYLNIDVDVGLTPETTETIRFQISRSTITAMFPGEDPLNLKLQDNWLMTLICRELGYDDAHVWEVYARAGAGLKHPIEILKEEYEFIKKLEGERT